GTLPVRLAAGDLNGDGRDDLVVLTAGSRQVLVYLQNSLGGFGPEPTYRVGVGVSPVDVALADLDGDGRLDIAVANQVSSDVSVLLNTPGAPFTPEARFRAGPGLYSLDERIRPPVVHSLDGTASLVAGRFAGNAGSDLIV